MDDMKDKSIHFTAQKLSEDIQNMKIYHAFYTELQKLVSSPSVKKDDFKNTLLESMKKTGMETDLRNTVFHWVRSHNNRDTDGVGSVVREPLTYLRKAQLQWEKRIHKSLNSMCGELGVPLARLRLTADREELDEKWTELSTYDIDLSQYRPVYAPKDFLEVLLLIRSPNYRILDDGVWDFTQIPLKVKTIVELVGKCKGISENQAQWDVSSTGYHHASPLLVLIISPPCPRFVITIITIYVKKAALHIRRALYQELSRGEALLGVNPYMASSSNFPTLEAERSALGEKVLQSNQAPVAQEFLKRGSPRCLRGRLWAQVLGSAIKQAHREYFEELKQSVLLHDLMVDKLIIKDVQLTASNDDQYFVFEDLLYQVMLCFSRDTEVLSVFNHSSASPINAVLKNRSASIDNTVVYPPSGVIPFHGFTMYATPFCYLYDDPVALYHTLRAFYMRYWFRLHEVSSHPQGLLALCILFERLLQRHEPHLWLHFKLINVQPIRVVFKWLMRSFSGHLPPEQLLMLWDLVLAYDSLEIQALLAVAILSFRRENLLQVNNQQNVEAVLADLSSVAVMPLLQLTLMRD